MGKDVIIACDFSSKEELYAFLEKLGGVKPYLKIGMELFYKEGPALVKSLTEKGARVFLDLKLHDIPNTVCKAAKNLASLGAEMINVHAGGGIEMMRAAMKGIIEGSQGKKRPLLIAVTCLTSISPEILKNELNIDSPLVETVKKYALNAKTAGLDGAVCSPLEAPLMKELGLMSVTPGIRAEGSPKDDQKRTATPREAKELGSDYIVVGRPITGDENPLKVYNKFVEEFVYGK
jgi:orotidine 5''-phosphate decarboxylase, subfamily 1